MARIRHRKTINPFRFQREVRRPDWSSILDPDKPVEVDLGFGRGEFILEMAQRRPDVQFVGLEIRDYLIDKVRDRLQEEPRPNVYVMAANVKEHLPVLFDPGTLYRVYIHFPDPWTTRKKHHKRRMVDARLVATLHDLLQTGAEVHLMTDKEEIGQEMRTLFEAHGGFENACGEGQFCLESTTGVRTREELYYVERGDRIYRLKFVRRDQRQNRPSARPR
jgi:tRNA (guanine-N7-)-methyltransferase